MTLKDGCKGCCVFAHEKILLSVLAIILAITSLGLNISVHATCNFVKATDPLSTKFGVWTKENIVPTPTDTYSCQEYDWTDTLAFDTKWIAAGGLAYAAGIIGFIFTVLLIASTCVKCSRTFFIMASVSFAVAGILILCTLVGLNSDICEALTEEEGLFPHTCEFSTGAGLAIGAGSGYLLTAALVLCIHPSATSDKDDDDENGNVIPEEVVKAVDDSGEPPESTGENEQEPMTSSTDNATKSVQDSSTEPQSDKSTNDKEASDAEAGLHDAKQVDDDEPTSTASSDEDKARSFGVALSSDLLFLLGSMFNLWLAVLDLQWANEVVDFAGASLKDQVKWWWNSPEYDPQDCVFRPRFHCVSYYQIIYFLGAFFFMVEGYVDLFGSPDFWGIFFIFAGTSGLVAAWLGERDPRLSGIFELVSAHLFLLEAIGLLLFRNEYSGKLKRIMTVVSLFFFAATTMDLVLGYYGILKWYNLAQAQAGTAAAALWLFSSCCYVCVTLFAKRRGHFDRQNMNANE